MIFKPAKCREITENMKMYAKSWKKHEFLFLIYNISSYAQLFPSTENIIKKLICQKEPCILHFCLK